MANARSPSDGNTLFSRNSVVPFYRGNQYDSDSLACTQTQNEMWTVCGGHENNLSQEVYNTVSVVQHNVSPPLLPIVPLPSSTLGVSRNVTSDSAQARSSCSSTFSTGSPVTVLPPELFQRPKISVVDVPQSDWAISFSNQSGIEESLGPWMSSLPALSHEIISEDQLLASPGRNFLIDEITDNFGVCDMDSSCMSKDFSAKDLDGLMQSSPQSVDCHVSASSPNIIQDDSRRLVQSPEYSNKSIEQVYQPDPGFCQGFQVAHGDCVNKDASAEFSSTHSPNGCQTTNRQESQPVRRRLSWSDQWQQHSSQQYQMEGRKAETLHLENIFRAQALGKSPATEVNSVFDHAAGEYRPGNENSTGSAFPALQSVAHSSRVTCTASANSTSPFEFQHSTPTISNGSQYDQKDAAALSALLYRTQGNELIQKFNGSNSSDCARHAPAQKLRRRHGTATDPQSIAARTRRERFSDRIGTLRSLVPNGERLDTVSMLGHTFQYVLFLQHQIWQLYHGKDGSSLLGANAETLDKWKEFMEVQTVA